MGECLIMRRGGETYKVPVLSASYPQDVSTTVIKGNTTSATFNAVISEPGNPAEYTYQWYVNGNAVSGATGSSYTKSDLSTTATYTVYCEVTNKAGTVQSRTATLSVTQYYTPTLNTSYPANASVTINNSTTLKASISTAGNPASYTYQWYKNGTAISGATSATYTFTPTSTGTTTFYCKVTNAAGTVTSRTATITANAVYLYNAGDNCTSLTGGWQAQSKALNSSNTGAGTPAVSNGSSSVTVTASSSSTYRGGIFRTTSKIDLSNYDKIRFTGTATSSGEADRCRLCIWSAIGTYQEDNLVGYVNLYGASSSTKSLDISSLSGSYYVGFGLFYSSSTVPSFTMTKLELY